MDLRESGREWPANVPDHSDTWHGVTSWRQLSPHNIQAAGWRQRTKYRLTCAPARSNRQANPLKAQMTPESLRSSPNRGHDSWGTTSTSNLKCRVLPQPASYIRLIFESICIYNQPTDHQNKGTAGLRYEEGRKVNQNIYSKQP